MNDTPKLSIEEQRFINYQEIYRQVPAQPLPSQPGATSSTATSKATKTIASRRNTYGPKATSPSALAKLQNR